MRIGIRSAALAALVSSLLVLAACGGGDDTDGAGGGGGGGAAEANGDATATAACKPAPAGTKVTLKYSSWVPGAQKVVDLWNKENPDIQVDYREVPSGQAGSYKNYINAIKAGRVDDLGFVEFEYLPTFRLQGGLQDIGGCAGVKEVASKFVPWAWKQATFGENGPVYAIPHDTAAMAYFYRKDLFDKHGLQPPKTWTEFYELGRKVKQYGGRLVNVSAYATGFFPGLVWQKGGQWFQQDGSGWKVSIDNPATREVAEYWQKILDEDLATKYAILGEEYNRAVNTDRMWGMIGGSWMAKLLEAASPKTKGDWRVAELPQWTAGEQTDGNWGGGNVFVFKGSKHPAEAAKFAVWLNSHPAAQELNVANGGIFPATAGATQSVPALQKGTEFLGGQQQWQLFDQLSARVPSSWIWGPTQLQLDQDLQDGVSAALGNKRKLTEVFADVQAKTVAAMKDQAISVGE